MAAELGWEREVGIAVVWLFLLERFLTCVGSFSLEPDNTGAPTDGILMLPLLLALVAAPHLARIY